MAHTIIRKTYFAIGQPIATRVSGDRTTANNGLFYFHSDHHGSATFLTHGNGHGSEGNKVANSTKFFTPFGEYRIQPPSPTDDITDRGFTGHKHNDDIGLIYMNARYYLPNTNRWVSPDSIIPDPTNPQSYNRYSYTLNNPVRFTDPTGHYVAEADDGDCKGSYEVCDNPETLPYLLVQGQTAAAANVVENGGTDDLTAMEYILTFSYSLTEGPAEYRLWQSLQYATASFYRSDIPDFFGVPDYSYQRLTNARFGVSGFDWEFVGDVANTNQLQHFIGEAYITVYATYFIGIPGDGPGGASVLGWAAVRYQDKPWDISAEAAADRRLGDMAVDLIVNSIDAPSGYLGFLDQTIITLRGE